MYAGLEDDYLSIVQDEDECFPATLYRLVEAQNTLGEDTGGAMVQINQGMVSWFTPDEKVVIEDRGSVYRNEMRYFLPPDWSARQEDYLWVHTQPFQLWRIKSLNDFKTHFEAVCTHHDLASNLTYSRGCAGLTTTWLRA